MVGTEVLHEVEQLFLSKSIPQIREVRLGRVVRGMLYTVYWFDDPGWGQSGRSWSRFAVVHCAGGGDPSARGGGEEEGTAPGGRRFLHVRVSVVLRLWVCRAGYR